MRVVAFTGLPGAGKSEAVEVARQRGLPIVRMGEFVWEQTKAEGLPLTDENVGRVATRLRKEKGPDVWAQRTCDEVLQKHSKEPLVVIDGVRTLEEVETFRRRLGDRFVLVAVHAAPEVRQERLLARRREDDASTVSRVKERDEREKAWGIERAIERADHLLANQGPLPEFRHRIEALLDRISSTINDGGRSAPRGSQPK